MSEATEVSKEQVVNYLSSLPVIEIAGLVKELEEKWGVSAAPIIQSGPAPEVEAVEEQTDFTVILEAYGESKMQVIKAIRAITQLGLKESKAMAEGAPIAVREDIDKDAADEVKAQLEAAGAKVSIK